MDRWTFLVKQIEVPRFTETCYSCCLFVDSYHAKTSWSEAPWPHPHNMASLGLAPRHMSPDTLGLCKVEPAWVYLCSWYCGCGALVSVCASLVKQVILKKQHWLILPGHFAREFHLWFDAHRYKEREMMRQRRPGQKLSLSGLCHPA